jgi:hypothetical protein
MYQIFNRLSSHTSKEEKKTNRRKIVTSKESTKQEKKIQYFVIEFHLSDIKREDFPIIFWYTKKTRNLSSL